MSRVNLDEGRFGQIRGRRGEKRDLAELGGRSCTAHRTEEGEETQRLLSHPSLLSLMMLNSVSSDIFLYHQPQSSNSFVLLKVRTDVPSGCSSYTPLLLQTSQLSCVSG